jgi:hypothetical protein
MNKDIKFVLLMALGILIGSYGITLIHEQVHIQIYESYGIKSQMYLLPEFPNAYVLPESSCPTDNCILAHNINEVVGYTAQAFLAALGFLLIFYKLSKEFEDE